MPLRLYRRFRAGPFRLNVSKGGISASVGGRGAWFTVGPPGTRSTLSLPGTSFGYYRRPWPHPANDDVPLLPRPYRSDRLAIIGIAAVILTTLALIWR